MSYRRKHICSNDDKWQNTKHGQCHYPARIKGYTNCNCYVSKRSDCLHYVISHASIQLVDVSNETEEELTTKLRVQMINIEDTLNIYWIFRRIQIRPTRITLY